MEIVHVKLNRKCILSIWGNSLKRVRGGLKDSVYLSDEWCEVVSFEVFWKYSFCKFIRFLDFKCLSIIIPADDICVLWILLKKISNTQCIIRYTHRCVVFVITSNILYVFERNPGTVLLLLVEFRLRIIIGGVSVMAIEFI